MAEAHVLVVGAFENGAEWQAALDGAGLTVTRCLTAFDALTKLNDTKVDVIVSNESLADLSPSNLCAFLRVHENTSALPFIVVGESVHGNNKVLESLAPVSATITARELQQQSNLLINLIDEQLSIVRRESKPQSQIPFLPIDAQHPEKPDLDSILNYLLSEILVSKAAQALAAFVEPHKHFLEAYFAIASQLTDADILAIAVGSLKEPWIAVSGKIGIKESALNELVSELKSRLSLSTEPLLKIDDKVIDPNGTATLASEIFSIPVRSQGVGMIVFAKQNGASFQSGSATFSVSQHLVMNALKRQMVPILELLLAQQELAHAHSREAYNASIDQLTGLYNLQFLLGFLQQQLLFSVRHKLPVGLLIMDIDNFQSLNAALSVQAGDAVLAKIASSLLNCTRASDLCARYGGDEFAVVLPNTDLSGAQVLAEKIRLEIEALSFFEGSQTSGPRLTLSIGCAEFDMVDLNPETILRNAKLALQRAKENGKNCIEG